MKMLWTVTIAGKLARSDRGSALIAVTLTLLVIAAIAASLVGRTKTDLLLSRNLQLGLEHELIVEAAIHLAILSLSDPGATKPFAADGRPYGLNLQGKRVQLRVQSEAGKINLNLAPNMLLRRLFNASCVEEIQAETIVKTIENRVLQPNTLDLGDASSFNTRKITTASAIKHINGMNDELFDRIEPYVSVYNFSETPDFGLAPELIKALMTGGQESTFRPVSAESSRATDRNSARTTAGIFTIAAFVQDVAPPSMIKAVVYITGDRQHPYRFLEWRYSSGVRDDDCKNPRGQK